MRAHSSGRVTSFVTERDGVRWRKILHLTGYVVSDAVRTTLALDISMSTLLFMSAATLKPIRLERYLPRLSGANKVSLFRADSLARYLLQCVKVSSVVAMDKTVVGLNVATRSCNVYPDKCWFAVLCRFWLQCSRTIRREINP
jgi:hypothetical protein